MRVIGGRWRGRQLPVADVRGLRPTGDRVRETLFNWLQPHVGGARCLDLFAGSGALGFEAASRGAASVTLIERDAHACAALEGSIALLDAASRVRLVRGTAAGFLATRRALASGSPAEGNAPDEPADAGHRGGDAFADARPGTDPSAGDAASIEPFDIVFVDPPFDDACQADVLAALADGHLAHGARVYVEAPARQPWSDLLPGALELARERTFGEVVARLLRNG